MRNDSGDEPKEVARQYVAAVQAGDEQAIRNLFASEATWTLAGELPFAGVWKGRTAIIDQFLATAMSYYQPGSISLEITGMIAEQDQVVLQWTSRARTRDGRPYENGCIGVFTIRDGQIQDVREYMDTLYAHEVAFSDRRLDPPSQEVGDHADLRGRSERRDRRPGGAAAGGGRERGRRDDPFPDKVAAIESARCRTDPVRRVRRRGVALGRGRGSARTSVIESAHRSARRRGSDPDLGLRRSIECFGAGDSELLRRRGGRRRAWRILAQSIAWEPPGKRGASYREHETAVLDAGGVVVRYGQLYGPGTYFETETPPPPRIQIDDAATR